MARNSSGTHSLPTGNPVVTGTAISSTVHNNTNADFSAEITDSLSRSGKGPMQAPLELTDGTKTLPSLTFDADPDSGFYRAGSGDVRLSCNDTDIVKATTAGMDVTGKMAATGAVSGTTGTFTGVVNGPNGAVGAPTYAFTADSDSGIYLAADGNVSVAVAGAQHLSITTTGIDAKTKKVSNVVDPATAQDAATKNYVDVAVAITPITVTAGTDWTNTTLTCSKIGGMVFGYLFAQAGATSAWNAIATIPAGSRPVLNNAEFLGYTTDASSGNQYATIFGISPTTGVVAALTHDNGSVLSTAMYAIGAGDVIAFSFSYKAA